ncbi:recombinase family protein [Leptolyngbya sp. FACHB-671]|uniref:recombinase family protein n=1 Tax=Leptolyngbya sp. FACHB-671 TaxID=2692812 RepID=UPI0016890DA3|nr:recombinase family protein [Leptolyngbya sp. FACHB-671]MBD2065972.1 recombinase family protein [Leptolyngbya sp. FACHB-671]
MKFSLTETSEQKKLKAGYIRVSTLMQEDESLSLDRQKAAVEAAGATVVFKDTDSGSKDDRKNLQRLLELVQRGEVDEVIVSRIDRLTRSLRQLLDLISEFERLNVNLRILDMNIDLRTPMGKFMVMLIGMFAEWETDQLSERIKSERRQRRQKLIASDSCPFGYEVQNGKYVLDRQPFLCLLSDRPENYPTGEGTDTEDAIPGRTIDQLCRELVKLFLEDTLPRTTLGQFFERYGIEKPRHKSNGFGKRLYWTPSGFLAWLTNPVLQGHTAYLKQITVKKRKRETNPNGPEIHRDTHPNERLISSEEAQEITELIRMNRRIGGGNFREARNQRNQHAEFAYQSGIVYCAQCGSRCTSKTSGKGKYRYFACRYSGAGCNNKKSVYKTTIEQKLIQHLVAKSEEMREAAWATKRMQVSGYVAVLQASEADEETIRQFLWNSRPQYEDLEGKSSALIEQQLRIKRLEEQLQDLKNVRGYNPSVERLKQELQQQIEEANNAGQSLLEKTAGEIIFEGNTSYFWDGLTNEDKSRVFEKIVPKIFINQGKVTEILLRTEQQDENRTTLGAEHEPSRTH